MKRILGLLLAMLMLMVPVVAQADQVNEVVSLGGNLSDEQKASVLQMMGVDENMVQTITVTIDEEKALLGDYISADKIGSRSISSAYVKPGTEGSGIVIKTYNINWVTEAMYASALATAGLTDVEVVIAAPFEVSGTAALAGIYKAYECAADSTLSDEAKSVAAEELVTTGELADVIGADEAASFIAQLKDEIIKQGLDDPDAMRQFIADLAQKNGITLTDSQLDQLTDLAMRFVALDLDPEQLADQIRNFAGLLDNLGAAAEQTSNFFAAFGQAFRDFFQWIADFFKGN